MTNKELQRYLKEFPDDMEVAISYCGISYVEPHKPYKRFMGTSGRYFIVLDYKIDPYDD